MGFECKFFRSPSYSHQTSTDNVDFGRLLQGFQESKLVTLTSASSIPVRWKV